MENPGFSTLPGYVRVVLSIEKLGSRRPAAHEKAAQTEPQKEGLTKADARKHFPGFVPGILGERLLRGIIEQVDEAAIVGLLKFMERPAQQQMHVEFPAQGSQLAAHSAVQDCFSNAHCAT